MSLDFEPTDSGMTVTAGPGEMAILGALPEFLVSIDGSGDEVARLHPPAYPADDRAEAEFQRLVAGDLDAMRRTDASQLAEIIRLLGHGPAEIDIGQAEAMLRGVGTARIALAARSGLFDLPELPEHPMTPQHTLVQFLGFVQESLVEALSYRLDVTR